MANPDYKQATIKKMKAPGADIEGKDSSVLAEGIGIHNTVAPSLADGDYERTQMDDIGNTKVTLGDPAQITELTSPTPPSGINNGSKAVATAGTAETLVAGSTTCKKVWIWAKDGNTGTRVYFGGATVSSTSGAVIYKGGVSVVEIDNVQKIYIDVDSNGDGVQFTYTT